MRLSDLVERVESEIGEQIEKDDLDPQLILQFNGLLLEVDDITVNSFEIVLKPRTVGGM